MTSENAIDVCRAALSDNLTIAAADEDHWPLTTGEWKNDHFTYKVPTADQMLDLVFDEASASRLLECLERVIEKIAPQGRHWSFVENRCRPLWRPFFEGVLDDESRLVASDET